MATNTVKLKIQSKYDTYENWVANNPVLLKGEIAIASFTAQDESGVSQVLPTLLIKVGDGTNNYNALPWVSATAADVYDWAKAETKPSYNYSEIQGTPSIGNGTVTIKKNGVAVGSFNLNDGSAKEIDITVDESDTNTTYTFATGEAAGKIKVTPSEGESYEVAVAGWDGKQDKLTAGSVSKELLAADVQSSLDKADSALQADALADYATDSDVSNAINTHNSDETAHSDIRQLITNLQNNLSNLGNVLSLKGVGTFEDRPEAGTKQGEVYIATDTNKEYIWNGTAWEEFGAGDHLTKAQADGYYDAKGAAQALVNTLNGTFAGAASKTPTSITQTNGKVTVVYEDIAIGMSQVTGLSEALEGKENAGTAQGLINALNVEDAAVDNQYVSAVSESKGKISVTRKAFPTPNDGKLMFGGVEIFSANSAEDVNITIIDCGDSTN